MASVVPQVWFGESKVYANLTPTFVGREVVPNRSSAQGKTFQTKSKRKELAGVSEYEGIRIKIVQQKFPLITKVTTLANFAKHEIEVLLLANGNENVFRVMRKSATDTRQTLFKAYPSSSQQN